MYYFKSICYQHPHKQKKELQQTKEKNKTNEQKKEQIKQINKTKHITY